MANYDVNEAADILKEYYDPQKLMDTVYKKRPFFGLVPKFESLEGKNWPTPIIVGDPQNTSALASNSFAGTQTSQTEEFLVKRIKGYNRCTLDNEAMLASSSNKGAFIETATLQIDGALNALSNQIGGVQIWREGWGDMGTIVSFPSATSFKLTNVNDVVGFERGQALVFASSQHSSTLRSTTVSRVTAVNRATGVVTTDQTLAGLGVQLNDYIFINGDRQNSATPSRVCLTGVGGWIPVTAPSASEDFFGVDRSVDPTRLAGQRVDVTGMNPVEAFDALAGILDREGASPDYAFMNSIDFANFRSFLAAKQFYNMTNIKPEKDGVVATISFGALEYETNFGSIKVVPDPFHPSGSVHFLTLDTWDLGSLGEVPQILNRDGEMLRMVGEDAYEVRVGHYSALRCTDPSKNGVLYNLGA